MGYYGKCDVFVLAPAARSTKQILSSSFTVVVLILACKSARLVFDGSRLLAFPAKNSGVYSTDVDPRD
jgi:hypothetical protein